MHEEGSKTRLEKTRNTTEKRHTFLTWEPVQPRAAHHTR